jgi:hypothetical protein
VRDFNVDLKEHRPALT